MILNYLLSLIIIHTTENPILKYIILSKLILENLIVTGKI